ncbi:MAG: dTDP-4-dehydrorhamnose reductase [bacterium]
MKIVIIGSDGQLGTDLGKVIPPAEQIPLTIDDLDITDRDKTMAVIKKHAPQIVINTAAYHNTDKCEDHQDIAFAVNAAGAKNAAEAAQAVGAAIVHISTDYVFDGKKKTPYFETDEPKPLSVYGRSKLEGEKLVAQANPRHFIVRSTGLYGAAGCLGKGGANFVETMIKLAKTKPELKVVDDEVLSPTYTYDLANKLNQLVQTQHFGLYHIVNQGGCTWYEFAVEIFKLLGRPVTIKKAKAADFNYKIERPKYSVLQNNHLAKIGLDDLRPWPEALRAYLIEKGYLKI